VAALFAKAVAEGVWDRLAVMFAKAAAECVRDTLAVVDAGRLILRGVGQPVDPPLPTFEPGDARHLCELTADLI
jgi:hypothetical protein